MYINKIKLKTLMEKKHENNYHEFSRQLDVETAQLHRLLNKENTNAGSKFLGKFKIYCDKNNLKFDDYIFLNKPLTACNILNKSID